MIYTGAITATTDARSGFGTNIAAGFVGVGMMACTACAIDGGRYV